MNLKLFTVMGISWILEIISTFYKNSRAELILDTYNLLLGVFIFFIFVFKRKVLYELKCRFGKSICSQVLLRLLINHKFYRNHTKKYRYRYTAIDNYYAYGQLKHERYAIVCIGKKSTTAYIFDHFASAKFRPKVAIAREFLKIIFFKKLSKLIPSIDKYLILYSSLLS